MRNDKGSIDWEMTEEIARGMEYRALGGAIADILAALPAADARDRDHTDRCPSHCVTCYHRSEGGYYRDCISVYRREIERRKGPNVCRECGAERCK